LEARFEKYFLGYGETGRKNRPFPKRREFRLATTTIATQDGDLKVAATNAGRSGGEIRLVREAEVTSRLVGKAAAR
jgi:hypothetical protein